MVYACDRPVGASNLGSSPGRGNCCELHCDETSSFLAVQAFVMVHLRK